jgi:NAD(P)-dependent dehydrogenase (short-subunit alcohol dehydrogenase family)
VTKIHAAGGTAAAIIADLADAGSTRAAADEAIERFGRIDVLGYTAGML